MSSTLDRLRRLQSLRPQRTRPEPTYVPLDEDLPPEMARQARHGPLEELAPGEELVTPAGACYVVTEAHPLAVLRGSRALGDLLAVAPRALALWHPEFGLDELEDFAGAAFIDTETTGLGNGAGIYAFMVGVGTFEALGDTVAPGAAAVPSHFVVRQFFMRHPGEEGAVLAAVADLLGDKRLAVTFNGRGFDLPLLRGRYLQNRRLLAGRAAVALLAENAPHLDLLMPARRLWRRRLQSCRLINLEQVILGIRRTQDDVAGALIPYLYLDYVRTGNAGEMSRVFYHNREDIVSMVSLAQRLIQAYTAPEEAEATLEVQGEDWLSLGAGYTRCGDLTRAEWAYRHALEVIADDAHRALTFAQLGDLLKRQARWDEAAAVWELWLTSVPGVDPTPYIELAKCCEWQWQDLERAEMWTAWALHNLRSAAAYQRLPGQTADLERRLARIRRKRGTE
jgi:uncharacterized protein YprB with RNaseH-like and TPR domain